MSNTSFFIGRKIGQYTINSFIANGGMADVYQAIDKGLDREVALKLLFPQYSRDSEFTQRFQREARSAAKLRHPNIVQVYATGATDQGDQYIAMEFVDGGTLEDKLSELAKDGKLIETNLVLLLMLQIADALREAHETGIIHRDLKPSNILLRANNSPVLTDLGIAISSSEARLTHTNKMMGTPDYMSPEQATGEVMDGRSDIYSFGVLLYELLCGRRPFAGDSAWIIVHKQISEDPPSLEKIRPGLPPLVYEIVERCMQKNPDDRYQTANELVQVLTVAAQVEGVTPTPNPSGSFHTVSLTSAGVNPPSGPIPLAPGSTANRLLTGSTGAHQRGPRWGLIGLLSGLITIIIGVIAFLLLAVVPPKTIRITAEPPSIAGLVITTSATTEANINQLATVWATSTLAPALAATEVIVATETPEPTPSPTHTVTPTPSPTATKISADQPGNAGESSNPAILGSGNGLPIRFEGDTTWGIGQEKNGSFENTTEKSYLGKGSGRLDYTFTTEQNDYVVFLQVNPIDGTPNTISAWVYGDGSDHFINAWILDSKQQVWQVPLGQVFHLGWRKMTGKIETGQDWPWEHISGPNNNKIDYPIQFYALVLDDFNSTYIGDGTIYIDNIEADTLEFDTTPTPQADNAGTNSEESGSIIVIPPNSTEEAAAEAFEGDVGRIIYTSGNSLFTTDPSWDSGAELGTASNSSCNGTPSLITGQSFNVYRGSFCPLAGPSTCTSPNGQAELLINMQGSRMTVNVRSVGDSSNGTFIYEGIVDTAEGIRWSPDSQSFIWVSGDTLFRGFTSGSYQQLFAPVYNPIISPDSQSVLYRKPVAPGINDIWVAQLDGSSERNVTNSLSANKTCAVWATGK